ncbi:MAG TPA: hypothetical protein VK698_28125, partial [Kofleriaceae bacterium]|nr:hypothetical protein [Kofleriaceae bacterium]
MNRVAIAAVLAFLCPTACAGGDDPDTETAEATNDRGDGDGDGDGDADGDDIEDCPQLCKVLCADAPDVPACVAACIDGDCDGPYQKSTPICNYLDRGLLDHRAQVVDHYVVFQPGVSRLSDIDTVRFGLDLPDSYCKDAPHGFPCSDESYDHSWWIDRVDLSVLGIPLFHEERENGDANLLSTGAGAANAGIQGFDAGDLRSNPLWGLSFDELRVLFKDLVLDENKQLAIDPGEIVLQPPQVAGLLEGMIGRSLAATRKGCVNDTYCDDKSDKQVYWSDNPDCDQGGCPPTNMRLPSPWLEIRGSKDGTLLQLDIDLDVMNGSTDLGDCDGLGGIGKDHCGTQYSDKGRFSAEVDLQFTCAASNEDKFSISVGLAAIRFQAETGLIGAFPRISERKIADQFDKSVFDNEIAKNLDTCPVGQPVTVSAGGGITIHLDSTVDCDDGVACIGHRVYTGGSSFAVTGAPSRRVPAERAAAIGPWVGAAPTGSEILAAMEAQHGVPFDDIPITATHTDLLGPIDPAEKIPMSTLNAAVPLLCAMATSCADDLDFGGIEVPPPIENVDSLLDCTDPEADPDSIPCQTYLQMRAFVQQPAVLDACIQPLFDARCQDDPDLPECQRDYEEPDRYDGAMAIWLIQVKGNLEACTVEDRTLEDYIPVPFIDLTIRNGSKNVTNGFSFVDFQEAENVTEGEYEEYECRHRPAKELIPDPYDYPQCDGEPGDPKCEC